MPELAASLDFQSVAEAVERNEQTAKPEMIERLIETILEAAPYLLIGESKVERDLPSVIADRQDMPIRAVKRIFDIDVRDVNALPCPHPRVFFVIDPPAHHLTDFLRTSTHLRTPRVQ